MEKAQKSTKKLTKIFSVFLSYSCIFSSSPFCRTALPASILQVFLQNYAVAFRTQACYNQSGLSFFA